MVSTNSRLFFSLIEIDEEKIYDLFKEKDSNPDMQIEEILDTAILNNSEL